MIVTEYLHINHHAPWEDKANNEPDSIYTGLTDDQCQNVIDALSEVEFDIDINTGKVRTIRLSNGQSVELKDDEQAKKVSAPVLKDQDA